MHVLLADALDEAAVKALEDAGHTVDAQGQLTADDLATELGGVDALVVRSTKVIPEALEAADQLALVVRAGAGTENIDMKAASGRGVHVCNVPGRNAVAVAELTLGLLLAVDRHIAAATADLQAGKWNKRAYSKADGLMGRTIGIVGLGEIGMAVAERAKAFGLTVVGLRKPGRSAATEARLRAIGIRLVDSLEELVSASDIVTLHVPGGPETKGLFDAELISQLRDGAILLNTSRGDCVDETALIAAMDNRGIRVGLDVFCDEPSGGEAEVKSDLAGHESVVGTHHIGASTRQAQLAIAAGVVETIEAFSTGTPVNCVNLASRGTGSCSLMIRHYDRVGVLAAIFGVLRSGGLNVQHMENRVFEGRAAAVAVIEVSEGFTDEFKEQLEALDDVIGVGVVRRDETP
ncbi:MAG: NAD(P)-dependent oxidoreductase [Acidimicrobiales bacterium]